MPPVFWRTQITCIPILQGICVLVILRFQIESRFCACCGKLSLNPVESACCSKPQCLSMPQHAVESAQRVAQNHNAPGIVEDPHPHTSWPNSTAVLQVQTSRGHFFDQKNIMSGKKPCAHHKNIISINTSITRHADMLF